MHIVPIPSMSTGTYNNCSGNWEWYNIHNSDANTVILYHFEDATGSNVIADTMGTYNGAYQGVENTDFTKRVAGKFNYGGEMTTNSGWIDTAYTGVPLPNVCTVEFWCYVTSWAGTADEHLFSFRSGGVVDDLIYIQISDAGGAKLYFRWYLNKTNKEVSASCVGYTVGWNHFALQYSETTTEAKAFLNGVQFGATQSGIGDAGTENLTVARIGCSHDASAKCPAGTKFDEFVLSNTLRY